MKSGNELVREIEAILFYLSYPVKKAFLSKTLEANNDEIDIAILTLKSQLSHRGITLIENNNEVFLTTSPDLSPVIDKITKEEKEKELGKASLEVLAIVSYKGPVSKKEIEYIRGVNSQYAIRNLLLRGLIEKVSQDDLRSSLYKITSDTIRFLGLSSIKDLKDYEEVSKEFSVIDKTTDVNEDEIN